jgi:hypothetical protein
MPAGAYPVMVAAIILLGGVKEQPNQILTVK